MRCPFCKSRKKPVEIPIEYDQSELKEFENTGVERSNSYSLATYNAEYGDLEPGNDDVREYKCKDCERSFYY